VVRQVQFSLASFLSADSFASTASPASHTAIRCMPLKKTPMRHFQQLLLMIIMLIDFGCNNCKDSEKQKYISQAFSNFSTSPDYVVFTAIDIKTNKSKEICCESDFLYESFINDNVSHKDSAALVDTYKRAIKKFANILIVKSCDYTFGFKSTKSLKDIGFYDYNVDSVKWYTNIRTFAIIDSIKKNYKQDKISLLIDYFKKDNIYLIHVLNKNGVYCGLDCESGYTVIRKIIKI
jgi:hypothetical protein